MTSGGGSYQLWDQSDNPIRGQGGRGHIFFWGKLLVSPFSYMRFERFLYLLWDGFLLGLIAT